MTFIPSIVGMPRTRQRKRLTRRKRSRSAPAILKSPSKRSAKRKVWTDTQIKAAIDVVKSGGSAALDHGVPCTTLKGSIGKNGTSNFTVVRHLEFYGCVA